MKSYFITAVPNVIKFFMILMHVQHYIVRVAAHIFVEQLLEMSVKHIINIKITVYFVYSLKGQVLSFPMIPISISNDFYLTKYERFFDDIVIRNFRWLNFEKCLELWNFELELWNFDQRTPLHFLFIYF